MLAKTLKLAMTTIVGGALSLTSLGADAPVPPLNRPVSVSLQNGSLAEYLLAIFKSGHLSGGIAVINDRCEDASDQFPEFNGNVKGAFEKLATMGHQVHWLQAGDNLVVNNTKSPPSLLKVVVHEFRFSRNEPLSKATSDLLDTPEASAKIKELQLKAYGPELGFAQMHRPGTPQDTVTLSDTTVLDALNKIAAGHAVWLYKESRCGENVISLNWPVK